MQEQRRQHILAAARQLVLQRGLRATTMEALARAAGVAKPTLYAYFPNRAAVADALGGALLAEVTDAFGAGLAGEGDVVARIGTALAAKHKTLARLLEGAERVGALDAEGERFGARQVRTLAAMAEGQIAAALAAAGCARPRPLSQLLVAAAAGVGRRAASPAEIGPAVRLLTERLLRPELGA